MHQLLNSSQQQYERSSSGHRSQELFHIQQERQSSSPDLQRRRRAWSVTRTLRLILAAWQAPSELIDRCWEGFWIHLSCRETALQQHRHWATRAEGMETEQSAAQHVLQEAEWNINTHFLPLCGKANVNDPKEDARQAGGYIQIAKYPDYRGVKIPSTGLGLQRVAMRFSNLTHHPQRFKQTRRHASHLIQLSLCKWTLFRVQYTAWVVSEPRT